MVLDDTIPDTTLVSSLASKVCPNCGRLKNRRHALCYRDFSRLPKQVQDALYRRLGEGYREALAVALDLLGARTFHLPPDPAEETDTV